MKISLIIPMYNEEAIVEATLREVSEYMKSTFLEDYEILCVNDGSTDKTPSLVAAFPDPAVKLVSYGENRGKGYAVRRGALAAAGDVVLFTDCDLAYGTGVIKTFYDVLTSPEAPDLAVGSRVLHERGYGEYTLLRRLVSRTYILVLKILGGLRLSDSQCGCKGFRLAAAKTIFSVAEVDRFAFDFEAILLAEHFGMRFCEVPVAVERHGKSSVRVVRDTLRMLRDLRRMKKRIKAMEK
ncbi:MAG: glycosyltransferase [Clostridia bacterium]|nr:glycosyltransferase [Clostridia bacterium]